MPTHKLAPKVGYLVGQRVVVRNAMNELKRAVVVAVPRSERDWTRSEVLTTRGRFPKTWVSIEKRQPVPWPIEDIFTDLPTAEAAQRVARKGLPGDGYLPDELRQRFPTASDAVIAISRWL